MARYGVGDVHFAIDTTQEVYEINDKVQQLEMDRAMAEGDIQDTASKWGMWGALGFGLLTVLTGGTYSTAIAMAQAGYQGGRAYGQHKADAGELASEALLSDYIDFGDYKFNRSKIHSIESELEQLNIADEIQDKANEQAAVISVLTNLVNYAAKSGMIEKNLMIGEGDEAQSVLAWAGDQVGDFAGDSWEIIGSNLSDLFSGLGDSDK